MNEFCNAENNLVLKRPLDVSKSDVYNQGSVPFKVLKSCRPNLSQINLQKRNFNFSMTNLRGTHLNLWNDVQKRVVEKNQNHFISSRKNDELINIYEINTRSKQNLELGLKQNMTNHSLQENF